MPTVSLQDVICPHCLRENPILECMSEFTLSQKRLLGMVFLCRSCNGVTVAEVDPDENTVRGGGYLLRAGNYNMDIVFSPNDDTYGEVVNTYPEPNIPLAPEHVPPNISNVYFEAKDNFMRRRFSTSVMLARKALDISTKVLGVADGINANNLSAQIFKLKDSGKITNEMAQWAKIIRLDGNASVHSDEEFSESETRELLNFVETFLLYAFTLPAMVAANKHTS
ncbi:hypothetical protein TI10_09625 [Photorhabdus luminescens subsp. luminescens]|uniref:DUF4145 domain-containing protein n=1 Tax=Photorhabdus luminescens TaxID=29488 RepID=A0A1G5RFS4_PHOLU|nr:DUF4145 domain-containing protein [Photorhabdus luminescens]KMW73331.1 hypothetical protein TI10_09625 [Photorhabdus luminescens subsp. luminescens]SCZ72139.1 protein of unknown function [Photorhabdus luminescens]